MDYQNRLTFLGDSTTAGMIAYKVLPDGDATTQVWRGAAGNTITFIYVQDVEIFYPKDVKDPAVDKGVPMKILDAAKKDKPEYLVITLGVTGGVSLGVQKTNFQTLYKWLIDGLTAASPDTKIIVQSIYPVGKERNTAAGNYSSITNEPYTKDGKEFAGVKKTNEWIKETVRECYLAGKNVRYLDVFDKLIGSDGWMDPKFGNGDGLHIGPEGYAVILENLRTHAWM